MGILVVPTWKRLMNGSTPGTKYPSATPTAMAERLRLIGLGLDPLDDLGRDR